MAGAWTDDKIDLNQRAVAGCRDGVTDYRNMRFFGGSNEERLTAEEHRGCSPGVAVQPFLYLNWAPVVESL
jgi:hypothetical protein